MPALLRRIMKYRRCDAFVVIPCMYNCHFRSSERVTPSRRVLLTSIVVVQRHFVTRCPLPDFVCCYLERAVNSGG